MYARVNTFEGLVTRFDQGVELLRERVVPGQSEEPGFAGAFVLSDRSRGKAAALTLWETEAALRATEELAERLRADAQWELEAPIGAEHFELAASQLPALIA